MFFYSMPSSLKFKIFVQYYLEWDFCFGRRHGMYFWVILAAFVAEIFYLVSVPIRADIKQLEGERQAEPVIVSFITQHEAAVKWAKDALKKANEEGEEFVPPHYGTDMTRGPMLAEYSIIDACEVAPHAPECQHSYYGDPRTFMPPHWNYQSGVRSFLFCLDSGEIEPYLCCLPDSHIYVASFKVVDTKWMNFEANLPSNDFRMAMLNYSKGRQFGYNSIKQIPSTAGGPASTVMAISDKKSTAIKNSLADIGLFYDICGTLAAPKPA
jgi:hypothetical protein